LGLEKQSSSKRNENLKVVQLPVFAPRQKCIGSADGNVTSCIVDDIEIRNSRAVVTALFLYK